MERREALRLLATAAAIPLVPGELNALLRRAREETKTAGLRTLNPEQNALVIRMAEVILPETDTPGATAAHVNEFIDLILTEWYTAEERDRFLAGLRDVDSLSRERFGKGFVALTPEQQHEIVTELDREMVTEIVSREPADHWHHHHSDKFFGSMKQLTLTGYFTSEAGATGQLHFKIIPGHYDACVPADSTEKAK